MTNLAFLATFKYLGFAAESYNQLITALGLRYLAPQAWLEITLPLGISFYTFQSMSYTIDVYLGHVRATRRFIDFGCFVTLFPQLVAGPIVRFRSIASQLRERQTTLEDFSQGLRRFVIGLAKKVLIANIVAIPADAIFDGREPSFGTAWLGIICYTLQIYFDFSGYSDMAIGLGMMLGFRFPENFDYPYIARSIQGFWRRWHISLSTWFRDYLYIPLGGNRRGRATTYRNLILVFALCGLWHGAAWNFLVWGLFHGFFLIMERMVPFRSFLRRARSNPETPLRAGCRDGGVGVVPRRQPGRGTRVLSGADRSGRAGGERQRDAVPGSSLHDHPGRGDHRGHAAAHPRGPMGEGSTR